MTVWVNWVIRGPSGNQGHTNETLVSIFLPSKRFIQCLKKYYFGAWGAPEVAQRRAMAPVSPLGTSLLAQPVSNAGVDFTVQLPVPTLPSPAARRSETRLGKSCHQPFDPHRLIRCHLDAPGRVG